MKHIFKYDNYKIFMVFYTYSIFTFSFLLLINFLRMFNLNLIIGVLAFYILIWFIIGTGIGILFNKTRKYDIKLMKMFLIMLFIERILYLLLLIIFQYKIKSEFVFERIFSLNILLILFIIIYFIYLSISKKIKNNALIRYKKHKLLIYKVLFYFSTLITISMYFLCFLFLN